MLSGNERERYLRQLAIEGFGEEAQEGLRAATVFVAGAGGLGCAVALYLAAAGIGKLRVADNGRVEPSNLNRQVLYTEADAGRPKVAALAARLAAFNSSVAVEPMDLTMDGENLRDLLEGCTLAVDALDNLPTRYLLNRAALDAGIPLVHGAVHGFRGQAMTVLPRESPCLMCLYQAAEQPDGMTPVIGVAPGTIALIQTAEAVKSITGLGRLLAGRLLLFDGLDMSFTEVDVQRDPLCPHCGGAG